MRDDVPPHQISTREKKAFRGGGRRQILGTRRNKVKTAAERSAAAKKANETRRANKLAQKKFESDQRNLRAELWEDAPKDQKDTITENLNSAVVVIEDEYEQMVFEWYGEKCEEIKDSFRDLLRAGTQAKLILAAIEDGWMEPFHLAVYQLTIVPEELLQDVLVEDEFLGMNQPTPEKKQAMWERMDTYVREPLAETKAIPTFTLDENMKLVEVEATRVGRGEWEKLKADLFAAKA